VLLRNVATTAIGVIALAVAGASLGPQWDPLPLTDPLIVSVASTAIGGSASSTPIGTYQVTTRVVRVQLSDDVVVEAQISEPVGAPGQRQGVVFIHGAGTGKFTRAFVQQAHDLASAGIVTMVPNKRLDTYTTRHRDYTAMAADYEKSVELLRAQAGVDPARVGVYGESEGAWIIPIMTAADPRLAFAALISAPVVPPREQAAFAADSYLRNTDVPGGVFRAIPRAVGMEFPGGGFEYADFDVTPYQRHTTAPVFVAYGTADASMPTVQGAQQIISDLAVAGNNQYTVRYYAGANHGLRVNGELAVNLDRDLTRWISTLPVSATAEPRIAGDQPHQAYLAQPLRTPRWFGDGDRIVITVIGAAVALVVGAGLCAGTRLFRRRGTGLAPGLVWPMFTLALGAVLTVVALVVYLVAITRLALDYDQNRWVVQGGWLGVRLLGVATVVAAAVLTNRLDDLYRDRERRAIRGVPAAATMALVVGGSTVLLITAAYWGVFQLGI